MWRFCARLRVVVLAGAAVSPLLGHAAVSAGQGVGGGLGMALLLALLQSAACGIVAAGLGLGVRLAVALAAGLLAVLAASAWHAPEMGLLVAGGIWHAATYLVLLAIFGASLRAGRVDVVTGLASRLNPRFQPAQRRYTRRVSWAWSGFFAAQLLLSAGLLAAGWVEAWRWLVQVVNLPMVLAMAAGEYALRRTLFPGPQSTDLAAMVRAFRRR